MRVSKYQTNFVVDLLLLNDMGTHQSLRRDKRPEQASEQNAKKKTEIEKHAVPKLLPPVLI